MLVGEIVEELPTHQVSQEEHHTAHVVRHHLPRHRGKREEDRCREEQIRPHQGDVRLQVRPDVEWPELVRLHPGRLRRQHESDDDAEQNDRVHRERPDEPAAEKGAFRDRRAVDQRFHTRVVVAIDRVSGDRGNDGHAEQRDCRRQLGQGEWRVGEHLAAAAENRRCLPKCAAAEQHEEEPDERVDAEVHPRRNAPEVVADLPTQDGQELWHQFTPVPDPNAGAAAGASVAKGGASDARAPRIAAKYTSSKPGSAWS